MLRCRGLAVMFALAFSALPALAQQAEAPSRIGVFDPEKLWRETEVGKRYNQDLSEARDRLQAGISKKEQEIDALVDKLRQQQASLSEDKAQQMQKDIQGKRVELNRMNEDATNEMKQHLNEVQGRFQKMLIEALQAFGREKNFALILNLAVVDYNAPQIDITTELIARFNEMHKAPPAAAGKTPAPRKPAEKPKEPPKDSPRP